MADKLYEMMDWARIEAVVYSEENAPREILGARISKYGIVIQCFFPESDHVSVKVLEDNQIYPMVEEDEAGFYAVLIPGKKIPTYKFIVEKEGEIKECYDAYAYGCQISNEEERQMLAGICYTSYEKLGAHPLTIDSVDGVYFAVWAPNAIRVSVVGDFNHWDGRIYQMNRLDTTGIYELFIPGVQKGDVYKYEIKTKQGELLLKSDPYANATEIRPANASVVADLREYKWNDTKWMKARKKQKHEELPMYVYELHLGSWKKSDTKEFYNYRELAPMLIAYVKEMGYTHIELMPIMEHPYDQSWGYQVTGYYAPTSRYGTCEDFRWFIDAMHQAEIGVILDWVPAHFPKDQFGLARFDGTCLYEHEDPRQGEHPHWGTLVYNYGSPFVTNFLIANVLFWAKEYHVDGIRMDAVASMLYLDYGRNDGEWIPNIYGGNENLEAMEFLKHLNSRFKKEVPDVCLIAEESTAWPKITEPVEEDGLGFDYKWNMGWMNDFVNYMSYDPVYRGAHHSELTFSMVYAYSEKFMLSLSHDEVVHGKGSLLNKMPGTTKQKFANLRVALGFMMAHPGKKLVFMGQEFGQSDEWSLENGIPWEMLNQEEHMQMQHFSKALIQLYKAYPAFYKMDYEVEGFEWINNMEYEKNMLTFMRKTKKSLETIVIVCNFSALAYEQYHMGVPYPGKYKEIFNSDAKEFGGTGCVNPRVKMSKNVECDERKNSITIKVPPLGMSVFKYTKAVDKVIDNKTAKERKKEPVRRSRNLKKELEEKMTKE